MCWRHWRQVPYPLRVAVTTHYYEGQERGLRRPTRKWIAAARDAIASVASRPSETAQGTLFVILLIVTALVTACATFQARRACRPRCSDVRGPVMTWSGGPTVPPRAWDECMRECEALHADHERNDEQGDSRSGGAQ